MKKLAMVVAIAALGATSHANAAFTPIVIDPDGALNGAGDISVSSLNWLAGNALTVGALGQIGQNAADVGGTRILTTHYQAQLNTFVSNSGGGSVATLPVSGSQWTVVASFQEVAFGIGGASASFAPIAGSVSIYFNNAVTANDITGLGYNLGTKILQGTVAGGSGTFTDLTRVNPLLFQTQNLDNFGVTNDAPGIKSHVGSGQSTLKVDIGASVGDFVDGNFFKTNISSFNFLLEAIEDVNDTGQLVAPFGQANPSDLVNGVAPSYSPGGVNGGDCAVNAQGVFTQTCDFHFQTTNVTSFNNVPEPGSLAIAGLGLGLLGMFGRRRKTT